MKKYQMILSLMLMISMSSCNEQGKMEESRERGLTPSEIIDSQGIKIEVYDFDGLKPLLEQDDDTLYVINFWATWCKPCVKELPFFERIRNENILLPVKVILVSLDFRPQLEDQLIPFMIKNGLKSEVMVLSDPDANAWIEQVDPAWSGAIPATLFVRQGKSEFYEKSFTYEELKNIVESKLLQI